MFSFQDLDCADGVCRNQLPYFSNDNNDMSLTECVVYLSVTPLIYFAVLIILEERLIDKLYAKMFDQKLKNACVIKDEEVEKEKYAVALEIKKLTNSSAVSPEGRFISLELIENKKKNSSCDTMIATHRCRKDN